jgi:hypothetical protein
MNIPGTNLWQVFGVFGHFYVVIWPKTISRFWALHTGRQPKWRTTLLAEQLLQAFRPNCVSIVLGSTDPVDWCMPWYPRSQRAVFPGIQGFQEVPTHRQWSGSCAQAKARQSWHVQLQTNPHLHLDPVWNHPDDLKDLWHFYLANLGFISDSVLSVIVTWQLIMWPLIQHQGSLWQP